MQDSIFVGRQTQLDELNSHWRQAFHKKQGKVVFLVGEAGIGKTSLVEQFSRSVLKNYSGVQYAYTQCDQIAGDISPYAPFVQVLNSLTEQAAKGGDNWFVAYMREVGPDVLGMVPVAGSLLTASAKSADFVWQRRKQSRATEADRSQFGQQDLFQQFTDTFRNIAMNKNPLLLCIDDWQWADTSSTNLLFHLTRRLSDVPLLLVATYRPHDAQIANDREGHPILKVRAEMERYSLCDSVELEFLSRAEVETYLNQRFPKAHFAPEFIDWLLKTTSGNALFTSEYLKLLLNEGFMTPEGQLTGELADLQPPDNIEAVIHTRLGYLDREARDMLAYGSVEGEQFTTLVLSRLLEIKPLSLLRKLRAIEETHHLIASLGRQSVYEQQTTVYRFVHILIRDTLYNILEDEEQVEINRLLLDLLQEIYQRVDKATKTQLLSDLITLAAKAKDYFTQAHYALIAAEDAAKSYAHTEAFKQYHTGLQALDNLSETSRRVRQLRLDFLVNRGRTEYFVGDSQQAVVTYRHAEEIARSLEDSQALIQILNNLGRIFRQSADYEQALTCLEESASLAQQIQDEAELADTYRGLADIFWRQDKYEEALQWGHKALSIYEELGDKENLAKTHNAIGLVFDRQGRYKLAWDSFNQARVINKGQEKKRGLGWNYNSLGVTSRNLGDYSKALEWFQKALAIWRELKYKRGEGITSNYIGHTYADLGDFDQALEWSQKALEIRGALDDKFGIAWAYSGIARALSATGDVDRAIDLHLQAGLIYEELENERELGWNKIYLGRIQLNQNKTEQALSLYQESLAIWQKLNYKLGEGIALHLIGEANEMREAYLKALNYYQEALTVREELGSEKQIEETRQRIIEVDAKLTKQENKE